MQTAAMPVDDVRFKRYRRLLCATQAIGNSYKRTFDAQEAYKITRDWAMEQADAADLTATQRENLLTVAAQAAGL